MSEPGDQSGCSEPAAFVSTILRARPRPREGAHGARDVVLAPALVEVHAALAARPAARRRSPPPRAGRVPGHLGDRPAIEPRIREFVRALLSFLCAKHAQAGAEHEGQLGRPRRACSAQRRASGARTAADGCRGSGSSTSCASWRARFRHMGLARRPPPSARCRMVRRPRAGRLGCAAVQRTPGRDPLRPRDDLVRGWGSDWRRAWDSWRCCSCGNAVRALREPRQSLGPRRRTRRPRALRPSALRRSHPIGSRRHNRACSPPLHPDWKCWSWMTRVAHCSSARRHLDGPHASRRHRPRGRRRAGNARRARAGPSTGDPARVLRWLRSDRARVSTMPPSAPVRITLATGASCVAR
jgi:hypothetical protein